METIPLYEPKVLFPRPEAAHWCGGSPVVDSAAPLISADLGNDFRKVGLAVQGSQPDAANGFVAPILERPYTFDYEQLVHSAPDHDERLDGLPHSVKRLATLLDRPQQAQVVPYWQAIANSTYQLNTSAVSTLIRVVDAADDDAQTAFAVLNAQHRQLAGYGWYSDWSTAALPAALFGGLTRNGLLDLLRETRRRQRRGRVSRRWSISFVPRLRGQLDRLAHFIVPNAPPRGAHLHDVFAGVAAL